MFCSLSKIYKCQHSSWKKTLGTLAQKNITWDSQQRNKAVALKAEFLVVFAFLDIYNIFYGFLMEFLLREHCNNWMMNRLNFSDKLLPSHSHARTESPTLLKRWPTKNTLRSGGSTALEKNLYTVHTVHNVEIVYIASTAHPVYTITTASHCLNISTCLLPIVSRLKRSWNITLCASDQNAGWSGWWLMEWIPHRLF